MATSSSNPSGGKKLPNFYEAMSDMGAYGGNGPKPGTGSSAAGGPPSAEKQQTAIALLEVVQKMERMETDPANKDLLQQMVQIAQQYMDKISPGSGKTPGTGTGEQAAPPPPAAPPAEPPAPPAAGAGPAGM